MSYNIIATPKFVQELKCLVKKYPSLKKEYSELINSLEYKPNIGTSLGYNCYKVRISVKSKGKGKSGGARVITYLHIVNKKIYPLSIYDKSEKENITVKELNSILQSIEH